ncbi:hypothetical protein BpHYR1_029256 [Brachionus plicatilis]|uniref:Uncharacterized protein n=1 Tax=Brachionus plicatilis TaxID=10195 RepID=A0A3M7S1Y2_BRAPC|nr:hypothetical protein BpHYR1_029256 [Brachionus plicatilis]
MHFVPRSTTSVCKPGCFPNILTICVSSSNISVCPLSAPFILLISTNNLKRFHHVRISCLGVKIVGLNDHSLDGVDSFVVWIAIVRCSSLFWMSPLALSSESLYVSNNPEFLRGLIGVSQLASRFLFFGKTTLSSNESLNKGSRHDSPNALWVLIGSNKDFNP